jgi:hypothetical protein
MRTTELAVELARQGQAVTVLFPLRGRDYGEFAATHSLTIKDLGRLRAPDIRLGSHGLGQMLRRVLRRLALLLCEYPDIELMWRVKRALAAEHGWDLLISIAVPYPIHWGVAWAWRPGLTRTWVADCGDPYMGQCTDSFRKLFYFGCIEKWFCRRADFLTVPLEAAKVGYYPEFHGKLRVIPQGFRFAENAQPASPLRNPVPTFAYAGGFIPGRRDPGPLLALLAARKDSFRFVCYTRQTGLLESHAAALGDRLEMRDYIPREQLLAELSRMDFLVNLENRTAVQSPSKLIDYALSGRPILSLDPLQVDVSLLNEFLAGDYRRRLFIHDLDRYDIRNVAAQFVALASEKPPARRPTSGPSREYAGSQRSALPADRCQTQAETKVSQPNLRSREGGSWRLAARAPATFIPPRATPT